MEKQRTEVWQYRVRRVPYGVAVEVRQSEKFPWEEHRRYLPTDEDLAVAWAREHDGQNPYGIGVLWQSGM